MIRYFDMFAGIGGFRAGLDLAGGFSCIGHCEIDAYADASYRAIHTIRESEVFYPDARVIAPDTMPDFDLLCAGFPCQSFSVAGKRQGFDDTRGTLFFEVARILRCKKPRYLLLENVPGLLSHDQGKTFARILGTLSELGYCVEWIVLNSKDYGVPQSRKRVFIVGYLDPRCAGKILPVGTAALPALVQIVGGPTGSRIYDPEGVSCTIKSVVGGFGGRTGLYAVGFNRNEGITHPLKIAYALNASNFRGLNRNQSQNAVLKSNDVCFIDLCAGNPKLTDTARCVTADYGKARMSLRKGELSGVLETDAACAVLTPDRENVRQQGRRIKSPEEPMFTLTAQDKHGVLLIKGNVRRGYHEAEPGDSVMLAYSTINKRHTRVLKGLAHTLDTSGKEGVVTFTGRVRRLVPRECLRLQGFSEDQIDRILAVSSDAQAYKQAGNSVTVNVIRAIGVQLQTVDEMLKAGDA